MTKPSLRQRGMTPRSLSEWSTAGLRLFGMFGLVACFLVWVITGRVEPLFVTAFGGLLAVGQGADALTTLKEPPHPPMPPNEQPEESG